MVTGLNNNGTCPYLGCHAGSHTRSTHDLRCLVYTLTPNETKNGASNLRSVAAAKPMCFDKTAITFQINYVKSQKYLER